MKREFAIGLLLAALAAATPRAAVVPLSVPPPLPVTDSAQPAPPAPSKPKAPTRDVADAHSLLLMLILGASQGALQR